ncbi:MAG TPA: VOC family protein [Actinophytocola sp.]|jgi:predicted enzyme related to lactoylglutathione lyase|nr:VOC family protein [Actinophytocola sp.]
MKVARRTKVERELPAGLPCWVELATTDEQRAIEFYAALFGWVHTVGPSPATPDGRYAIATLDGVQVAGVYRGEPGLAAAWGVHLVVRDTAAAAERIGQLGGTVTAGPIDIPQRGSIVHAVEPSGVPIVFWHPPSDWQFGTGEPGTFVGADLNTHRGGVADLFFRRLLGYASVQIGDRDIDYAQWRLGSRPVLYRYVMGSEYPRDAPPHWMVYFGVDPAEGTDATVERAVRLGGTGVTEAYDTQWGRTAVVADPDGVTFSLIDRSDIPGRRGRSRVDDPDSD